MQITKNYVFLTTTNVLRKEEIYGIQIIFYTFATDLRVEGGSQLSPSFVR